jgi:hypothetical protein
MRVHTRAERQSHNVTVPQLHPRVTTYFRVCTQNTVGSAAVPNRCGSWLDELEDEINCLFANNYHVQAGTRWWEICSARRLTNHGL